MNFHVLHQAELELTAAAIWYDDQQPGLGGDFLFALRHAFDRIAGAPEACAKLESYTGRHEVRRFLMNRFSYLVIYRCRPTETLVVAVSHVSREPLYWLDRLGS